MRFAIIGGGNMGGALARGLAQGTKVRQEDICVSNPTQTKLQQLKTVYPLMQTTTDNVACMVGADVIVLAVKPWKLQSVAEEIKPHINFSKQIVCSMVGGVGLNELRTLFQDSVTFAQGTFYYLIPNTAIATRQSMTFLASVGSNAETDGMLLDIFRELGDAMLVEERLMNAGMVLASCGIANALRYIRAASEGGVQMGFRPGEAQRIVAQTLRGAASLLDAEGSHPETEIDKVTTPGGLTIRGLNAMEQAGFTHAVIQGLLAALPKKE